MRPMLKKEGGKSWISHDGGKSWEIQEPGPDVFGLGDFVKGIGHAMAGHFGQPETGTAPAPDPSLHSRPDGRKWIPVKK